MRPSTSCWPNWLAENAAPLRWKTWDMATTSPATLKRAKKELGVVSFREGFGDAPSGGGRREQEPDSAEGDQA